MRTLLIALVLVLPFAFTAAAAEEVTKLVEAHLARGDGDDARAHVHVITNLMSIVEVQVEVFDADGARLASHTLPTRPNADGRGELSVTLGAVIDAKAHSARVVAFTSRNVAKRDVVFDSGRFGAQPMSCTGQCSPTRIECNNNCFLANCTSASYSCRDNGAGCEATCICLGCV